MYSPNFRHPTPLYIYPKTTVYISITLIRERNRAAVDLTDLMFCHIFTVETSNRVALLPSFRCHRNDPITPRPGKKCGKSRGWNRIRTITTICQHHSVRLRQSPARNPDLKSEICILLTAPLNKLKPKSKTNNSPPIDSGTIRYGVRSGGSPEIDMFTESSPEYAHF